MKRFIIEYPDKKGPSLATVLKRAKATSGIACAIAPTEFVKAARQRHCHGSNDEIEIDVPANMSEGEDGVWIQAWVFVPGMGSAYVKPDWEQE